MGPYKPLRNRVDEFIPYSMEIMENNGKPYEQMDDLGVPLFLETPSLKLHCTESRWRSPLPKGGLVRGHDKAIHGSG